MNMVEQLRATMGFEFTPESMLADFKNDPAYGPSLRDSEAEAAFFANIQKTMEQMKNRSFEAFGFAPTKLDAPDVSFLAIPDHPQHVLRFYRGSKTLSQSLGVLFMDVCDAQTRRETIIPPNFQFVQQAMAGSLIEPGKIESMEWLQRRSSGIEQPARGSKEEIPEKFSLYEGSVCGLEIDGLCAMTFQVPRPGMSIARPIPAAQFQFEVEK
ncbi:hypothetical protein C8R43DRAFT_988520 [Mycena crocata]|nr:hypothetical protein C8R43DRAFT_988520 [Mycena crocata]